MKALLIASLFLAASAVAQQSERFGPYELHYSVVNTTFIQPSVAATYGITRGKRRAILNLAVREHIEGEADTLAPGKPMRLQGRSWDLMQRGGELQFQEIREGQAVYYIAEFEFMNEEWRHFEIDFLPEGAERSFNFTFRQQVYEN